jgi:hypothetical protein
MAVHEVATMALAQGSGFFMQTARACGAAGGWLIVGLGRVVRSIRAE